MSARLGRRPPGLLCFWLLMWAVDALPTLQGAIEGRGSTTSPGTAVRTTTSSSTALGAGGKAKKNGEYSNAPGKEQTMMIQRALYVLVAVTALVVIYFVVRTIRMRRINRKNRKYGILNTGTNLENMEMRPLDQEDDDDDDTLFDVHHARR